MASARTKTSSGRAKRTKPAPQKRAPAKPRRPAILFEVAWETCNQLGGIYTVLKTKVSAMMQRWQHRYFLIGPYVPEKAALEFEELPPDSYIAEAISALAKKGVTCHFGRWLISGNPKTILIDLNIREGERERKKFLFWKEQGVKTRMRDSMADDVLTFGHLVADFLEAFCKVTGGIQPVVAHFHEWMGGAAIPLIHKKKLPIPTVFTTHGTLLGRFMSSARDDYYEVLDKITPQKEARSLGILPRYIIERLVAEKADVFATVSDLVASEAEVLLGRRPDVILPNGLDMERFLALHEFQALHRIYKTQIHDFVMGHFFGSYVFDLDKTLYIFDAGRYEYRNKGMDVFIESLAGLNRRMLEDGLDTTVVAFIVADAEVKNINVDVLSQHAMFDELRQVCEAVQREMGARLFQRTVTGQVPKASDVFTEAEILRIKRSTLAWQSHKLPHSVTHDLVSQTRDPVVRKLRSCGLRNAESDRVKVIFHPQFITSTSPILGMEYYQFVRGCNLGVFPSYYEPWGYTPMECVALGTPAVACDLSGFGTHLMKQVPDYEANGLFVLHRQNRSARKAVEHLTDFLYDFCRLTRRQRLELRNRVERISHKFDWSEMIRHYDKAHSMAVERASGGR